MPLNILDKNKIRKNITLQQMINLIPASINYILAVFFRYQYSET